MVSLTFIGSFSLGNGREDRERKRTYDLLVEQAGGKSDAIRLLLDLYGAALATTGTTPTPASFTAEKLKQEAEARRRAAAIAVQEADALDRQLEEHLLKEEQEGPRRYATAEQLVEGEWKRIHAAGQGEPRRELLSGLAEFHGIDERAVLRAAARRAQLQTDLRALPKPTEGA